MPNLRSLPPRRLFLGPQSLDPAVERPDTLEPPQRIPAGFDAVVQFDTRLLDRQLRANLDQGGALNLSARVPYAADGFPDAVRAAVAQVVRPTDPARTLETYIELRIGAPVVRSLGSFPGPSDDGDVLLDPEFPSGEIPHTVDDDSPEDPPVEIEWLLELNLLRLLLQPQTIDPTGGGTPGPAGSGGRLSGTTVGPGEVSVATTDVTGGPTSPPGTREVRTTLARGRVTTRMPSIVVKRDDLLQAWVELDVARTQSTIVSDGSPLTELLAVERGVAMVRTALALVTARSDLRLTPRVSLAGSASVQHVATLRLTPMHVKKIVQILPDGRHALSLCFNLGGEEGSPATRVSAFLDNDQFAYYVRLGTLAAVLKLRWKLRPSSREFVGDIPVEMALEEGSSETGEGRARLHVRLGADLRLVSLMAVESMRDDVLRLLCDQRIQLLRLWKPGGEEVTDLGELGEPATLPLVVNNQLFAKRDPDENPDSPLRTFLKFVLEPLARPLVESFEIGKVAGLASEALGAVIVRWSPVVHVPGGIGPTESVGGVIGGITTR